MGRFKGICFAIEDENTEVLPVPAEEVAVPAELVADVAEVESAEVENSEMQVAGDQAGEDLETLEEVRDVLEDSVEAGEGVDQPAAAIAEIAVESICRRLGMKRVTFMPAMESFGSKNNRVAATRIAVEGIGETIKNGWKALIEWLKKTWESIKAFFKKMFDANLKLGKAADEMKGKVAALSSDAKTKEAEIENKSLAGTFSAGAAETIEALVSVTTGSTKIFEANVESMSKLEGVAANLSGDNVTASLTMVAGTAAQSVNAFKQAIGSHPAVQKATQPKEGGFTVQVAGYKIGFLGTADKNVGFGAALVWEKVEAPSTKVKTLDKGQMEKTVAAVIELSKVTAEYKDTYAKVEKLNKISMDTCEKIMAGAEKLAKAQADGKETDAVKNSNEVRKAFTKSNSVLCSFATKIPTLNVSAGKAALEYVGLSLKQHKAD